MEKANYSHVTLVVDPGFGQRAKAQAVLGPLWVIQSDPNTAAIKELWASSKLPFVNAPTYFDAVPEVARRIRHCLHWHGSRPPPRLADF